MSRPLACLVLPLALITLGGNAALAQKRTIPVERDLERYRRLEDRLDWFGTGSIGPYYAPYYGNRYATPGTGVAAPDIPGFDGPPGGILRDSVGNSGPLPPGSPANVGNE